MKSHCKQLERFLSRYVDNELSPADKAWVEAHLSQCHAHDEEIARLRSMSARLREDLASLKDTGALQRLQRGITSAPSRSNRSAWDRWVAWRPSRTFIAATATLLVLGVGMLTLPGPLRPHPITWEYTDFDGDGMLGRTEVPWGTTLADTHSEATRLLASDREVHRRGANIGINVQDYAAYVANAHKDAPVWDDFPNVKLLLGDVNPVDIDLSQYITVYSARPQTIAAFKDAMAPAPTPESATPLTEGRKIIRNAGIALEVKDVTAARADVEALVIRLNGMIARVSLEGNSTLPTARLTLWIPAEHLDEVRVALRAMGKILREEVGVKDITADYFDTDTRLHNLKLQEERMLALYNRENAKLEEILKLETELTRIRTEIEKLEGQTRLWDHQVRFSAVDLVLTQTPPPPPPRPPIAKEKPQTFMDPLVRGVQSAKGVLLYSLTIITGMIAWFFVGVVWLLPWIVIALVGWFVYRYMRRRPKE